MLSLGSGCLVLALGVALYGIGASLYGARAGERAWVDSGRRAVYATAGVLLVAFAVLEGAFLRSDFALSVVRDHSSTTTPTFYRATAVWSSQEGSLLLWVVLLSTWSSLILFLTRRRAREVAPYATAVLLGFAVFFCTLLVFLENPFDRAATVVAEGAGLNPLLRHPSMMIHPPMLYSGYTLFAIPFAFAVGALITRRLDANWIRSTRPFTLAAWFFLGVGIVLGARWSYSELGWGGYWAWDPVENASLMPWLTGTAFLHSVMIQERRGMLKVWNVSLVLATGVLAILGTFLVRSGILDSIHAFGASTLGVPFVLFIALLTAGSIGLVVWRRRLLRSEHRLDSLVSRESIFLLNNLVLVGLCFVVFWGTFFPLISEALTGRKASVGPPWFDRYTVPLTLALVLLSGIGPVIAWRRATPRNLVGTFAVPVAAALETVVACLAGGLGSSPLSVVMFAFGAFVIATVAQELWRGTRARRAMTGEAPPAALVALVRRNRRRYGGYTVHVGMAVLFVGVAASSAFQAAREVRLQPGQTADVGAYQVRYVRPTVAAVDDAAGTGAPVSLGAVLEVRRDGKPVATLRPARNYYYGAAPALGPVRRFFAGESTSEVGLDAGVRRDVWTAVEPDVNRVRRTAKQVDFGVAEAVRRGASEDQAIAVGVGTVLRAYRQQPPPATFRMIVSPMVTWIWLGGLIVVAGAILAGWPAARRAPRAVSSAYAERLGRELGKA